ncbi:TPA: hypothetical protein ACH3X2_003564 [Trebouxia sp. C0005]
MAANRIADEQVSLPAQPGQPAFVISQSNQTMQYRVTDACTEQASCSCPQGILGYVCKHRVKVISLITHCRPHDIVLFLGTWAGSDRGDVKRLLQRYNLDEQPEPPSWEQLTEILELEVEVEQHERGANASHMQSAIAQLKSLSDDALLAQTQTLLDQSRGNSEMRTILLTKLNQATGSINQMAAHSQAGLSHPPPAIAKVQDELPDSTVRLTSASEGLCKPCRRPQQALSSRAADASTLPPVVPLPKPKPSKKKRSFAELLSSSRHADKGNLSDSPAGNTADTATGNTGSQPSKPANLSQKGRCGQCKTCLKPKSKKACLVRAAERAALSQAGTIDVEVASTAV